MSAPIYSDLKMAWHALRDGGLPKYPKQVQVILSDLCNQDCSFCAYRMTGYSSNELFMVGAEPAKYGHNNPKRFMPTERALALLAEMNNAGVLAVQWTGGGEPTVHADHEAVFEKAEELGFKQALVSNGINWSDTLIDKLARFSWVRVSIDAGTEATYAKIRNCSPRHFAKALGNVARLANKIAVGQTPCVLGVGYVVTPDNYHEIAEGCRLAKESGAAYIRLSAMFNPEGIAPYADIYKAIKFDIEEARAAYASDSFAVHDLFGDRVQDLIDGPPDYPTCHYQSYNTYVGADMNVYRCCVLAYNKRGLIGSIRNTTFQTVWEKASAEFPAFDARGCDRCQFNAKNRAMNYVMGDKPSHVEFP